jgi:hypothetical protein
VSAAIRYMVGPAPYPRATVLFAQRGHFGKMVYTVEFYYMGRREVLDCDRSALVGDLSLYDEAADLAASLSRKEQP